MGLFTPKKKKAEITFIEENVIIVSGEKYHHHSHELSEIKSLLKTILKNQIKMGANTDKALQDLAAIKTQITKVGTETATLLQKIIDLENAAASADTPQSVLDAIADVKAQAQVVDDQVPDTTP